MIGIVTSVGGLRHWRGGLLMRETLVILTSVPMPAQADALRAELDAEGIEAFVQAERIFGTTGASVWVSERDAKRAQEFVRDTDQLSPSETPWDEDDAQWAPAGPRPFVRAVAATTFFAVGGLDLLVSVLAPIMFIFEPPARVMAALTLGVAAASVTGVFLFFRERDRDQVADQTLKPGTDQRIGFTLASVAASVRTLPGAFVVPALEVRQHLVIGDRAKLIFLLESAASAGGLPEAESMWVRTTQQFSDGSYRGNLINAPRFITSVERGSKIRFTADSIFEIA